MIGTASVTATSYCEPMPDTNGVTWPEAGQQLLAELATSRDRYALIAAESSGVDPLVRRLSTDLDLSVRRLGTALADHDHPPTASEVETACSDATILTDLDLLLWPSLGIPVLSFLRKLARSRPVIAVWPGEIADQRARYSAAGRPDHYDQRLADVVVLRPRTTRFPDEVPYEIERIPR